VVLNDAEHRNESLKLSGVEQGQGLFVIGHFARRCNRELNSRTLSATHTYYRRTTLSGGPRAERRGRKKGMLRCYHLRGIVLLVLAVALTAGCSASTSDEQESGSTTTSTEASSTTTAVTTTTEPTTTTQVPFDLDSLESYVYDSVNYECAWATDHPPLPTGQRFGSVDLDLLANQLRAGELIDPFLKALADIEVSYENADEVKAALAVACVEIGAPTDKYFARFEPEGGALPDDACQQLDVEAMREALGVDAMSLGSPSETTASGSSAQCRFRVTYSGNFATAFNITMRAPSESGAFEDALSSYPDAEMLLQMAGLGTRAHMYETQYGLLFVVEYENMFAATASADSEEAYVNEPELALATIMDTVVGPIVRNLP